MTASTATTTATQLSRAATRRDRAARVGGWTYIVTGVGHLAIASLVDSPANVASVEEQMRHATVAVGVTRTLAQLLTGFSIGLGVMLLGVGALVLAITRRGLLQRRDPLLAIVLALSVALLVIAVLLLPAPPILTMTIAIVALSIAWSAADPVR